MERLRARAATHGHSVEAEAKAILNVALTKSEERPASNLYDRIRARFTPLGGADDIVAPLGGADDIVTPRRVTDHDPPCLG